MKLILILAGMQTSKIVAFGAQKIRTQIYLKFYFFLNRFKRIKFNF